MSSSGSPTQPSGTSWRNRSSRAGLDLYALCNAGVTASGETDSTAGIAEGATVEVLGLAGVTAIVKPVESS